jgi:hypothetical protein
MNAEGPALESLLHRLAETPEDFLAEPLIGKSGTIHVAAVAADLCRALGCPLGAEELRAFTATGKAAKREANFLRVVLIAAWLLYDPWFRAARPARDLLWSVLAVGTRELAEQTPSAKFATDPDRREELARLALARLGYRPLGESSAQAEDRLTSLSAVERARVLQAAKDAEARARAVREALAKKAAEESADKYSRE